MNRFAFVTFVLASTLLLLGLATYLLPNSEGELVVLENYDFEVASYTPAGGGAYVYPGRADSWRSVEYTYQVDGNNYLSWFIGLYFPLNLQIPLKDENQVQVYYLPFFHSVSMIIPGPDLRVVFVLYGLSISLLVFGRFFKETKNYDW